MTPSKLKYHVENTGKESHFFDRKSMKFFGDTMKNYGVRSSVIQTNYNSEGNYVSKDGISVEVWELYRKRAVKHGNKKSAYFCKQTFRRVHKTV